MKILCFVLICQVISFAPTKRVFSSKRRRSCRTFENPPELAATVTSTETLGGVGEFESWWTKMGGEESRSEIQLYPHALFEKGALRGLHAKDVTKKDNLLSVPRNLCLSAPFGEKDWDARLAIQLLKECKLGRQSDIYGYCALLCSGIPFKADCVPPSTSPDALRNWNAEQKARLSSSSMGKRLLDLEEKQKKMWIEKYTNIDENNVTFEQFVWAMEAVHSRAFKGLGAEGLKTSKIGTFAIQLIAGGVGLFALLDPLSEYGDAIAAACGAVALAPLIHSIVSGGESTNEGNAVLLPFIDSANHSENAESNIQYDPLKDCFTLSIGNNCYVEDGDSGRTQLFVSYGKRSDSELLLNYGFLTDYCADVGIDETNRDERWKALAEAFILANS